ncbi:MAG: hypothetical protein LHW64_01920 [Candidatus Cloacimonetes bacterium]|nr:hypothetical protein [Candidatus Cloacimonadota bacterium]MCB5286544.1 hypothetical protein [Candidatus Cloacimonadota bacterium]MCK9185213.1 hypothetical protein [Candidatus Cloacimonadota bacterium]MDY0228866.1 hypothetical protein [Candidatus Cloacimonadaceae bacterium]
MRKILTNQNGNLAIAMLLAVVGLMSGVSMAALALKDTKSYLWEFESIQSLHVLRGEAYRGQAFLEQNSDIATTVRTPERFIEISGSHMKRTFTSQSRIRKESSEQTDNVEIEGTGVTGSLGEGKQNYKIDSLVETKQGIGQVAYYGANKSMVRKYSELTIIQTSFSEFMYFTDNDSSPNSTNVYFYGYDVVTGKVHSNSDIRIKQAGGGNNGGWPTFLNLVTTAGHIVSNPANYPLDQVFQGGLVEEYEGYEFPPMANDLRLKGQPLGAGKGNIYLLTVNGTNFDYWQGSVTVPRRVRKIVYDEYPPPGDSLWTNVFSIPDTIWTSLPGGPCSDKAFFVYGDLWISGTFQGYQTWGCSENMKLSGDILLTGTPISINPADPMNSRDVVGLVSENSIQVNYAHMDPSDSLRVYPNMGSDTDYPAPAGGGIFIYAAMCALGDGEGNGFEDGVFEFEYQHPHPSTPSLNFQVTHPDGSVEIVVYDWIDVHRRRYPPVPGQLWPTPALGQAALDLPYYNPIWPERNPVLERGTINIWGAVAQRRRGFVHRSHNDGEYPSNSGAWNVDIDMCGHPTSPNENIPDPFYGNIGLQSRNWPGAAGSGVGYKKNYNYDDRLLEVTPLLYPKVRLKGGKNPMNQGDWNLKKPVRSIVL